MAGKRGKDFKLYLNSDSPYDDTPTWVEVKNVKDLSRTLEKALADASTRANSYRMQVGTLKELTVEFNMVYDPSDTNQEILNDAFHGDDNVEVLILDGSISTAGSKGIRFMAQVTKFGTDENLEEMGMVPVALVPGYVTDNLPRRVIVDSPGSVADDT